MKQVILIVVLIIVPFRNTIHSQTKRLERKSIVFISGFDEDNNTYYSNAEAYFRNENFEVVTDLYALDDILKWIRLHYDKHIYSDIHIVSHSNPWFGLSLKTTEDGERITKATLTSAINKAMIKPLDQNILSKNSKIIFHSCGLGKNRELLSLLKKTFSDNSSITIYASKQFNVFGGKYEGHYLSKTYYGYYPTAQSPGPRQLAQSFKSKYSNVNVNWEKILKTRTEQLPGDMYTHKFNIPVEWEFEFEDKADIPEFNSKEAIMDWVQGIDELRTQIEAFHIPIEDYRWLSKTSGNTLHIKGKTTVLCIMQPIMKQHNSETYLPIDIENEHYIKL